MDHYVLISHLGVQFSPKNGWKILKKSKHYAESLVCSFYSSFFFFDAKPTNFDNSKYQTQEGHFTKHARFAKIYEVVNFSALKQCI